MSTLTISLLALVVVVIGVVAAFNLWQSRGSRRARGLPGSGGRAGNRRRARDDFADDPAEESLDDGFAGGVRGIAARRKPAVDTANDWTRQRREPTFTVDGEDLPAAAQADDLQAMHAEPPAGARGRRDHAGAPGARQGAPAAAVFPATAPGAWRDDDGRGRRAGHAPEPVRGDRGIDADQDAGRLGPPGRLADDWEEDAEDLGPPEFEAPRLEPVPVEPPPPGTPTIRTAAFEATRPFDEATPAAGNGRREAGRPGDQARGPVADQARDDGGDAAAGATDQAIEPDDPDYVPVQVDHLVTLIPRSPVNAERLIALTSSLRHVGSKPIRIEIDDGRGRWVTLQSGTMVGCLRCSVLLANRQGPLNAVELSDFSASVEALAGQIGARYAAPDMNQVLREARELDAVAARLDTQVELGVEASEPIAPERLAQVARKLDLYDRGGGRYACFAENGDLLYLMTAGATMDMIAFVLDVPRTAQSHDAWRSMVACASSCAQLVRGRVVDSAGRGMSVGMIEMVGQQIARRYAELAEAGLKAGAPATLRVFN